MFSRIRSSCRFTLVGLLAICSTGGYAQVSPEEELAPPPVQESVDKFGIDLVTGNPQIPGMAISIGAKGSGLSFADNQWNEGDPLFNSRIYAYNTKEPLDKHPPIDLDPAGFYLRVVVPTGRALFKQTDTSTSSLVGPFELIGGRGSISLETTGIVFTDSSGSEYYFRACCDSNFWDGVGWVQHRAADLEKIVKSDGEIVEFFDNQDVWPNRFRSVKSSLGWSLFKKTVTAEYASTSDYFNWKSVTSVSAVNAGEVYCDVDGACNSSSGSWPHAERSRSYERLDDVQVENDYKRTFSGAITDAAGNVATLEYSYQIPVATYDVKYKSYSGIDKVYTKHVCSEGEAASSNMLDCRTSTISSKGRVKSTTIAGKSYSYSLNGLGCQYNCLGSPALFQATGPSGAISYRQSVGEPFSWKDNLDRVTDYRWAYGDLVNVFRPDNQDAEVVRDSRGNTTFIYNYAKDETGTLAVSALYPDCTSDNIKYCNKPSQVTTAAGVTTYFTYYPEHGGVETVTREAVDGVQAQTRYYYAQKKAKIRDESGVLIESTPVWRLVKTAACMSMTLDTCEGTADEKITETKYDVDLSLADNETANVLPVQEVVRLGDGTLEQITTTVYDIYGNVKYVDGPKPGANDTVFYFYDALRRVTHEIGVDPDGPGPAMRIAKKTRYDGDGKVTSVKTGRVSQTTQAGVDAMAVDTEMVTEYQDGLPVLEKIYAKNVLRKVTQTNYDDMLRKKCVAQRLNPETWNQLPDACALGVKGPEGDDRITKYEYDDTGELLYTTSALGTTIARKDREFVFREDNGLLEEQKDGLGNSTFYTYDKFNRPEKTIYPSKENGAVASTTDYEEKSYSGGQIESIRLRDGQKVFFEYDTAGRQNKKRMTSLNGALLEEFTYNNFDQIVTHRNITPGYLSSSRWVVNEYNALGWQKFEAVGAGSDVANMKKTRYEYNDYGQRSQLTWPDGFHVDYQYDFDGTYEGDLVQRILENNDPNIELAGFEYDAWGRRSALVRGNGVRSDYDYDDLSRLDSLATDLEGTSYDITESMQYTYAGQLKNRSFDINSFDYIFSEAAVEVVDYGTPNALNQYAAIDGRSVEYDDRGNMTDDGFATYTYNINNMMTAHTVGGNNTSLRYDAENRLANLGSEYFQYDGQDMIAETDANGNVTNRYVHGPNIDDPIVWYIGAGTANKRYLAENYQGSIISISGTNGANVNANSYDEYGIPSITNLGRFQYTGQMWLGDNVGLYYYKARIYNPALGRFMQTDPIGYEDQMNLYAYVYNDPMNNADPTGECGGGWCIAGGIILGKAIIGAATSYGAARVTGADNSTAGKQAVVGAVVGAVTAPGAGLAVKLGMNSVAATAAQGALASAISQEVVTGDVSLQETLIAAAIAPVAEFVEAGALAVGAPQLEANAIGTFVGASSETLVGVYADTLSADTVDTGASCEIRKDYW